MIWPARPPSQARHARQARHAGAAANAPPSIRAAWPTTRSLPLLEVQHLTKRYGNGVLACDAVSLRVQAGEVHAILGENGAGKSTLLKMLFGLVVPDAGRIVLEGRTLSLRSPADALALGIGLVPQHLQLVPSMTVAENVVLGVEPRRGWRLDWRAAVDAVEHGMQQHGLHVPAEALVSELSAGQQQRVAILKALHRGAKLLLLDEPTALLTPAESEALFDALRELAANGLTLMLISHKMSEVRHAADRFTVLRAGRVAGSGSPREMSSDQLASLMMGRELETFKAPRIDARYGRARLAVEALTVLRSKGRPALDRVSFDVGAGEILGVAGVEGNGQSELADVLGGLMRASHGVLRLDGKSLPMGSVHAMRRLGLGRIGEDRLHDGLAPHLSIAENLSALDYAEPPASRFGVLHEAWIAERARRELREHGVVARGPETAMSALSGGNMQKVVMARELATHPRCLVASQPTRGVDLGAAQRLHQALLALRRKGAGVLLLSADLDELMALSDRLIVLFEGRVVAHLRADTASPRQLGLYMTGAMGQAPVDARLTSPFTALSAEPGIGSSKGPP